MPGFGNRYALNRDLIAFWIVMHRLSNNVRCHDDDRIFEVHGSALGILITSSPLKPKYSSIQA
jgi:hypothetical protein